MKVGGAEDLMAEQCVQDAGQRANGPFEWGKSQRSVSSPLDSSMPRK